MVVPGGQRFTVVTEIWPSSIRVTTAVMVNGKSKGEMCEVDDERGNWESTNNIPKHLIYVGIKYAT